MLSSNSTLRRTRWLIGSALITFLISGAAARSLHKPVFEGPWERVSKSPVLSPQGDGFEAAGTFNPAVIQTPVGVVMIYRAQDAKGTSRLGIAMSNDGQRFDRRPEPVLSPEAPYEKDGGVEDPRLVRISDTYYLTYTGYNRVDAQLCLARSKDLIQWERLGVIMPANQGRWNIHWTKSGAILDHKVGGHFWMYFMGDAKDGGNQMGVAYSNDLIHWTEPLDHPLLALRPGKFDSKVVEPGPPPISIPEGILLVYNGADDQLIYRTGWAVFDARHPDRLIGRSDEPVFQPTLEWEKVGQVPNVVFVEGMVRTKQAGQLLFFYGGADKYVGAATASVQSMKETGETTQ